MGWLVDPDDRTVFVYQPDREIAVFDESDNLLLIPELIQGLKLTVAD
jgi:Uma2 family endonuclease